LAPEELIPPFSWKSTGNFLQEKGNAFFAEKFDYETASFT
jgi:hypothetical protein